MGSRRRLEESFESPTWEPYQSPFHLLRSLFRSPSANAQVRNQKRCKGCRPCDEVFSALGTFPSMNYTFSLSQVRRLDR